MTREREMVGPFPPTVRCEHCTRVVPVAPGRYRATVAHASPWGSACTGNTKRRTIEQLQHPAFRLAEQYIRMECDEAWDL